MHQLDGPSMRGKCLTPRARSGQYSQEYFHPILASFMVPRVQPQLLSSLCYPLGKQGKFPQGKGKARVAPGLQQVGQSRAQSPGAGGALRAPK